MACDGTGGAAVAATLARCHVGGVPAPTLCASPSARLAGVGKASGAGVRALGCGGAIRRLVGRAATTELHSLFREHSDDDQFGLQPGGTGKLRRRTQAAAATRPGVVVWATDISDAFTTIRRDAVIAECEAASPDLGCGGQGVAGRQAHSCHCCGLRGSTGGPTHGLAPELPPLSTGPHAVASRRARQRNQTDMCQAGAGALVPAYLDDTDRVVTPIQ